MKRPVIILMSLFLLFSVDAWASDAYPDKELRIIVNYGVGGGVDQTARSIQPFLPKHFGKTVLVENHKGAGGKIGLRYFLKQPADGYSVLCAFAPATTYVRYKNPEMYKLEDLSIINVQWIDPVVLAVRKEFEFNNLEGLIEYAKANPKKLTYAKAGQSSMGVIFNNALFEALGLDIKMLNYSASGEARAAVMGGHADLYAAGSSGMKSLREVTKGIGRYWNDPIAGWPEADSIYPVLEKMGIELPTAAAFRFFAVHREFQEKYPDRFALLVKAFKEATLSGEFQENCKKINAVGIWNGPVKSTEIIRKADAEFMELLKKN